MRSAHPVLLFLAFATATLASVSGAQVINEVVGNHTGTDNFEFVEVSGDPDTDYSDLTVLVINGDITEDGDAGTVNNVLPVGTTSAAGIWVSNFLVETIDHNDSFSFHLVSGWTGSAGADLDTNNDGAFDSTPWTAIIDSVAIVDGDAGDHSYGADTVLGPNFDGDSFSPGGASRIPNGTDTNAVADWTRNDWEGTGLPGLSGNLANNEAVNTPGEPNSTALPPSVPPIINEFVADHTGADTMEFIEIFGDANADYSDATIVVLDAFGVVANVYSVGTTSDGGYFTTGFLSSEISNDPVTFVLVSGWSGSQSDDLDTDNDGTLDTQPWTEIYDDVAVSNGAANVYSQVIILFPGSPLSSGQVGSEQELAFGSPSIGASRIPNGVDTDTVADWQINDFDLAGFDGSSSVAGAGEAWNTPGAVNRTNAVDYYASVDSSSQASLRSTLHATIENHQFFPYSSSSTDTWDILEDADENPDASSDVLTIYKNSTEAKFGGGVGAYNREHTWPKTYGFPDNDNSYPYVDCHHLRLANVTYNSDRGSRIFGTCNSGCSERTTDANAGEGGGSGVYPGNSNWLTGGDGSSGTWEAWDHRKGDVARSVLYMDVRYEGGTHGITGWAEPDLIATDNTGLINSSGGNTSGNAYMGRLSVLLDWHAADPPDAGEILRNDVIYSYQGNRNPFVDHPEWVGCVFENIGCDVPLFADGFETGDFTGWTTTSP